MGMKEQNGTYTHSYLKSFDTQIISKELSKSAPLSNLNSVVWKKNCFAVCETAINMELLYASLKLLEQRKYIPMDKQRARNVAKKLVIGTFFLEL